MFDDIVHHVTDFVRDHQALAPVIVGLLAFCESLAIVSFFVPATVILVGIGALIGASGIVFWPIWLGAVIGGVLGDWLSYWVGHRYKNEIYTLWPLSKYPDQVRRGEDFTRRYGAWGVFAGRFSGPLRAFVPLAAGVFGVPRFLFQMANISSAMVWAFGLLAPGSFLGRYIG